jgi:EAL domain-containing protein (putative c-di-GMP-specific phosphodiesterase class I)
VQDIRSGSAEVVLVDAIIAMGKSLRLAVVAEGIETLEQVRYLRSRHCTEGQGYYFGRPMKSAQFAELLVRGLGDMPCFSEPT